MIYFKCSQCGQKMEAPASMKGKLLSCPKCGSKQLVKNSALKKILLSIFILLAFIGIYKLGLKIGYNNGLEDGIWDSYKSIKGYLEIVKQISYQNGYNDALVTNNLQTSNDSKQEYPIEKSPILLESKISKKFPCKNVSFETFDTNLRVIGELTNDSNRTYNLINFRLSIYDSNQLIDTGNIMLADFEKNQTRIFETRLLSPWQSTGTFVDFNCYKIDLDYGM